MAKGAYNIRDVLKGSPEPRLNLKTEKDLDAYIRKELGISFEEFSKKLQDVYRDMNGSRRLSSD